jgi:hypothetical protein
MPVRHDQSRIAREMPGADWTLEVLASIPVALQDQQLMFAPVRLGIL